MDEHKTVISDEFWSRFINISKAYIQYDEEATIYDVFNLIREKMNGGWTYTKKFLDKIDADIAAEEG